MKQPDTLKKVSIELLLLDLPAPYRTAALKNRGSNECKHPYTRFAEDHAQAVLKAFNWKATPEQAPFWAQFYESLRAGNVDLESRNRISEDSSVPHMSRDRFICGNSRKLQEVYDELMTGEMLIARSGSGTHTSDYVRQLIDRGVPVMNKFIKDPGSMGDRHKYKVYYLDQDYIESQKPQSK